MPLGTPRGMDAATVRVPHLLALLRHPGGWNLRNLLAHGYLPNAHGGAATVSLYAAMRVIVLACRGRSSDRAPERDKDADEG